MTKIDVVSGFLGAGKTTLIKKLIEELYVGEKIVLIENEFGEVGIDGGFLKDSGIEISEMNSGCICCSLVGDFKNNLQEVLKSFAPERIIIEPSGVGKLSDVITSMKELEAEQEVLLNGLITVVNAKKALKQMRSFGEFFNNQIMYARTIVLSRTQEVDEAALDRLICQIKVQNQGAVVVTTPWGEINGKQLKEAIEAVHSFEQELLDEYQQHHAQEIDSESHEHREGYTGHHHEHGEDCAGHHHEHGKECTGRHHEHGEGCTGHHKHGQDCPEHHHVEEIFTSFGLETPRKFTKSDIKTAMDAFANSEEYGVILRAKGMLNSGEEDWIYFDFVDGDYEIRSGVPDYTGRICVIGTQIEKGKLEQLFR